MPIGEFTRYLSSHGYHYDGYGHYRKKRTGYNGAEWYRLTISPKWCWAEIRDTADPLAGSAWVHKKVFRLDLVWISAGKLKGVELWDL
jgi:hypothetical protein